MGNIIYSVKSDIFLADVGRGEYTKNYFAKDTRYHHLVNRSQGHNVPIINGAEQKSGEEFSTEYFKKSNENEIEISYYGAYGIKELSELKRKVKFENQIFTIEDYEKWTGNADISFVENFISVIEPEIADDLIVLRGYYGICTIQVKNAMSIKAQKESYRNHSGETSYLWRIICDIKANKDQIYSLITSEYIESSIWERWKESVELVGDKEKKDLINKEKIPVVFATDEGYLGYTCLSIQSIVATASAENEYEIIILVRDMLTDVEQDKVKRVIESAANFTLRFIEVGDVFDSLPLKIKHITTPTFYRLLLPELLPEYDKCVYIDGDTMVCKDIVELFNHNIEEYYIAGVRAYSYLEKAEFHRKRLEIPGLNTYINAGVVVMNLAAMRKNNWTEKAMALLPKEFSSQDQDIMNVTCYGKILELPYKYNVMTKYKDWAEERFKAIGVDYSGIVDGRDDPIIVHYADKIKPWSCFTVQYGKPWWKLAIVSEYWDKFVENKIIIDKEEIEIKNNSIASLEKNLRDNEKVMQKNKQELEKKLRDSEKEKDRKSKELKKITERYEAKARETTRQKEDISNLQNSLSFKIGRIITFIPRKIKGGLRCYKDNGIAYTIKRLGDKIKNK